MTNTQLKPKKQLHSESTTYPSEFPHPFLPPGSLTLLLGHPGIGKSLLALNLAAHLSRGIPFPRTMDHEPRTTPSSTLLLSAEDTQQTLKDRSAAMRADPAYLHFLPNPAENILTPKSPGKEPSLLSALRIFIAESLHFRLLILDPLPAFLGTHDCTHQNTIRNLLAPLLRLAEQHSFSILGITHLNKSYVPKNRANKNPLHQAIGSLAYTALARSVHLVTPDDRPPSFRIPHSAFNISPTSQDSPLKTQDSPQDSPLKTQDSLQDSPLKTQDSLPRRLVIPLKQNLTQSPHAYAFTIHPGPQLEWDPTPITNHPLLANASTNMRQESSDPADSSQLAFAQQFLTTTLAAGPILSAKLLREARSLGITLSTLNRARSLLQISVYHDGTTHQWYSRLPTPQFTA